MTTATAEQHPSRIVVVISVLGAIGCGALVAVQSRINGDLAVRSADQLFAAVMSFAVGLVLVATITLCRRSGRAGLRTAWQRFRAGTPPRWLYFGGLFGGVTVLSQTVTVGVLGVALFTVAVVAGQVLSGLVVDRTGFAGVLRKPLTPTRLLGAGLAISAALLAAVPQFGSGAPVLLLALPFLAGCLNSFQFAMNGRVRLVTDSAPTATTINFTIGLVALLVAFGVRLLATGCVPTPPTQWWLYLGGAIGVLVIGANTVLVRHIGVLLLLMATIAGQVVASLIIDALFFHHAPPPSTLIGAAITMIGVLVAAAPKRRVAID
ncbi:DMT family transporter [Enemella evansiae]|uniref:DMT family transporter n=1 Tax=Enemella evansiae TaxID=2016499 RepID=UPI0010D83522|nr:DMT family transporter [Enemella evansiae]TDO91913.1 transporter family-2 protein [Enemella evansiae]